MSDTASGASKRVSEIAGWITLGRAARRMNRHPFTLSRYIADGRLPAIELDTRTKLVRIEDVDRLIAERFGVSDLDALIADRNTSA